MSDVRRSQSFLGLRTIHLLQCWHIQSESQTVLTVSVILHPVKSLYVMFYKNRKEHSGNGLRKPCVHTVLCSEDIMWQVTTLRIAHTALKILSCGGSLCIGYFFLLFVFFNHHFLQLSRIKAEWGSDTPWVKLSWKEKQTAISFNNKELSVS